MTSPIPSPVTATIDEPTLAPELIAAGLDQLDDTTPSKTDADNTSTIDDIPVDDLTLTHPVDVDEHPPIDATPSAPTALPSDLPPDADVISPASPLVSPLVPPLTSPLAPPPSSS